MELINTVGRFDVQTDADRAIMSEALDAVVLMLSPIVPHICHRLWRVLGHESAVTDAEWPVADQNALHVDTVEIVVQVNGKLRARIQSPANASKDALQDAALGDENVRRFIADKNIRKIIVVPGKLVNVVV